jgi:hypothetical protein
MPPKTPQKRSKVSIIRFIYLYLITAITFIVFIIGAVNIVNQAFKSFVFGVEEYDYYDRPVVMMDCEMYLSPDQDAEAYTNCLEKQKAMGIAENEIPTSKFTNEAKRTLSIGIAQVVVAFPLWIFHWRIIERDRKERKGMKA